MLKCDPEKCRRSGQFKLSHRGQLDFPLVSLAPVPGNPSLVGQRSLTLNDTGLSHQSDVIAKSCFQGPKPPNEPINALFSSSGSHSGPGNAPELLNSNSQFLLDETGGDSSVERESQFMGFEPDFSPFDDSFSFCIDPPFLLNYKGDSDNPYSWKPDEFLYSVLSHSMFARKIGSYG